MMLPSFLLTSRLQGVFKVLGVAFSRYKWFAATLFLTSFLATILEVLSYTIIVSGISVLSSDGSNVLPSLPFAPANVTLSEQTIIFAIAVAGLFLILSAALFYISAAITARCRGRSFQDMITSTVNSLRDRPNHPFVRHSGPKGMARVLRRDCRYAAIAITDAVTLPRHIILCSIMFVIAVLFYPGLAIIGGVAIILAGTLQSLVGQQGIEGMDQLLASSAEKSKADRELVLEMQSSPYLLDENMVGDHGSSTAVTGFINAYQRRVRLAPLSDLVSRLIFIGTLVAVGVYLSVRYMRGEMTLASIVAIILAMRLFGQSIMTIAQKGVLVFSYAPLMGELLQFLEGKSASDTLPPLQLHSNKSTKLVRHSTLIGDRPLSLALVEHLNALMPQPERGVQIISGYAPPTGYKLDVGQLQKSVETTWELLTDGTKEKIMRAARREGESERQIFSLLAFLDFDLRDHSSNIVWEARSFLRLPIRDQKTLIEALRKRGLCIYYDVFPKRKPSVFKKRVYVLQDGVVVWLKYHEDFDRFKGGELIAEKVNDDPREGYIDKL